MSQQTFSSSLFSSCFLIIVQVISFCSGSSPQLLSFYLTYNYCSGVFLACYGYSNGQRFLKMHHQAIVQLCENYKMELHKLSCYLGDIILWDHFFRYCPSLTLTIMLFGSSGWSIIYRYTQYICLFPLRMCIFFMEKNSSTQEQFFLITFLLYEKISNNSSLIEI